MSEGAFPRSCSGGELADAAGEIFASVAGETWVRLRGLAAEAVLRRERRRAARGRAPRVRRGPCSPIRRRARSGGSRSTGSRSRSPSCASVPPRERARSLRAPPARGRSRSAEGSSADRGQGLPSPLPEPPLGARPGRDEASPSLASGSGRGARREEALDRLRVGLDTRVAAASSQWVDAAFPSAGTRRREVSAACLAAGFKAAIQQMRPRRWRTAWDSRIRSSLLDERRRQDSPPQEGHRISPAEAETLLYLIEVGDSAQRRRRVPRKRIG